MRALIRLMTVPAEKRDVAWLMEGLQGAIELEIPGVRAREVTGWHAEFAAA